MMMKEAINVVVAIDERADSSLVEAALPPSGRVNVAAVVHGSESPAAIEDPAAELLLVACAGASEEAAELVRRWSAGGTGRPVVALCEEAPEYFVQFLFQAGADDVVKLPETPERVMFTLEKALARHESRAAESRTGLAPMVCVLGPKGGTGKTVTASNLAVGLASAKRRTAVVDLDLQFGDLGLALGLQPERTVYDLATSGGALDAEKLGAYLMGHPSGARALLAPIRPDQASAVSTELMRSVYALLRATHDVVVLDTPPDFTPHVIAAVDACSHVCMVGMLDSLSLKNTKLGLETLELMGFDSAATSLVLNRANSSVGLTREDVEAIVGRKPDVLVPSDRAVPRSINEGNPVVAGRKRSPVASAYRELANLYLANGLAHDGNAGPSSNGSAPARVPDGSEDGDQGKRRRLRLFRRRGS